MLKKLIVLSSLLFVLSAGAAAASAQWIDLGNKEVKDRSEQDTWHVGKSMGEFRRIKLFVGDRAVRFYRLRVTFENGQTQEVEIRNLIPAGGETRAIDLKGRGRFIDKVDVWYEAYTVGRGVRSHVTLFGIR
jgi:hypothetical protein